MSSSPHLRFFFMQNSDFRTRRTSLYWSHTSSVVLSTHNSVLSTRIKRLYGFQPSPVVSCMQISDFNTRMASLYGFQLSSVVPFMQNSYFKTNLYWSQPSSVVFACKTATFGPAYKSLWVPDNTCLYVSQLSSVVFECKTTHFGPELQVSMGPRSHLWFLHAKHRLLDQHTSLYGYQT